MPSIPDLLASRLVAARSHGAAEWRDLPPLDTADAYVVQRKTLDALGAIGAWKIGLKADTGVSTHAPLPSSLLMPSGAILGGVPWRLRGIEAEVAVRLARDLDAEDAQASDVRLLAAIDAMLPVIEVVETRLASWDAASATLKLADLLSFGALVLGQPRPPVPNFDPRTVRARVSFDGRSIADTLGGNPMGDVARLLRLLAQQTAGFARKPKAGDIVTTGSCTGMPFAPPGSHVQAVIDGLGEVELRFASVT
jgi:2-keto-4-pentenoate hydratase